MKKKVWLLLLLMIVYIQVLLIVSGATYDWAVIIIEFLIILLIMTLLTIVWIKKYRKCVKAFNGKNYSYIIKNRKLPSFFPSGSIEKNYFYYMLAISYLKTGHEEQFLQYIHKIDHKKVNVRKYAWLTIYAAIKNNPEDFDKWQKALAKSEESEEKNFYVRFIALINNRRQEQQEISWQDFDTLKNELQ